MLVSNRAKKYLMVLKRAKIQGQLMREFLSKDLWSAAVETIDEEIRSIDKQRKVLELVKMNIKRRDKNDCFGIG